MHYILIWVQGSWKGTQAKKLVDNYNFATFSTWDALREHIKNNTEIWKEVKSIIESWNLVNDIIIWKIVTDFLNKDKTWKILFDWIPRNAEQKKMFDKLVPEYKVIFFKLDEKKARERVLWRMYNQTTWETFVAWTTHDPKTWEKLIKRKDDNEESLEKRIELFFNETMPILEEYKEEWKVIEINADQDIENVFKELENKLNLV